MATKYASSIAHPPIKYSTSLIMKLWLKSYPNYFLHTCTNCLTIINTEKILINLSRICTLSTISPPKSQSLFSQSSNRMFMRPSPSWRGEMYQKRFFNLLTRGQCILCIATSCRKLDARSIIFRQLKTASPRVRLFSAATSARDVRVTMEITWQFQCFS